MRILKWILTYTAAIFGGAIFMMAMHTISGWIYPEAAMSKLPSDPEAIRLHIELLGLGPKLSVVLSHWLGTAMGAFLAMRLAPLSPEWWEGKRKIVQWLPGWILGVWFLIAGIANAAQIPTPTWMLVLDLSGYIPAALWAASKAARYRFGPLEATG